MVASCTDAMAVAGAVGGTETDRGEGADSWKVVSQSQSQMDLHQRRRRRRLHHHPNVLRLEGAVRSYRYVGHYFSTTWLCLNCETNGRMR